MEFWGVEVKPGQSVKCEPEEDKYLHLSQASLGESKGKENVPVFVKINDQKLVLGTLSAEKCAQMSLDLVFEKEFELSHTSKNTSVYFCGYKSVIQEEQSDNDDYPDFPESELDPEEVPDGQNANGKQVVAHDQGKTGAGKANAVKEDSSAAKKAKKAEPAKADKPKVGDEDDEDDGDDEDDEDDSVEESDSEDMAEAMSDSDDEDEDESSEEEDEATPKKAATGKRPAADSASKTPAPEKKAKVVTPAGGQKTGGDGKKHVHVATPHPAAKKAGKTPGNGEKSKQQSPKSAGSVACKSCSRTFNSENALQAHTKAKHG